jgi:hypothetical protein
VERFSDFRFLGIHIEDNLTWSVNTTTIKKAQQRQHFLWNYQHIQNLLVSFYRHSVESILTYCICVWFSSCTAAERKALQRIITTAQNRGGLGPKSGPGLFGTERPTKPGPEHTAPDHKWLAYSWHYKLSFLVYISNSK